MAGQQSFVVKRDGRRQPMASDKIRKRLKELSHGLSVDLDLITEKVGNSISDGISTRDIDTLTAETCAYMSARHHPCYGTLAARVLVSNLHKETPGTFSEAMRELFEFRPPVETGNRLLADDFVAVVRRHAAALDAMVVHERDYGYSFFAFRTLQRSYLLRAGKRVVERPQYMLLRVAIQLFGDDLPRVRERYESMSQRYYTHATPTLFGAGAPKPQMSSCFLVQMADDSLEGIYGTLTQTALISKTAGGIGLGVTKIRSTGTYIAGTGGYANGIIPMLRIYDQSAAYVDQGGNKRPGSIAVYLEPWHADVVQFLDLRKNTGAEELRARNLFYGLWVPDLFMERVRRNETWSLFSPNECPGLMTSWGEEFERLYAQYEREGRARAQMPANGLYTKIIEAQIETGLPYMLYKDACNRKSNQRNLGTITQSNLCVAGDTLLLTDRGHLPIQDLEETDTNVWNGDTFSRVRVKKTAESARLWRVELSNGMQLRCTAHHAFILEDGQEVPAGELRVNAPLLRCPNYPVVLGGRTLRYDAYGHGHWCGGGVVRLVRLTASEPVPEKLFVPLDVSLNDRVAWVAGLLDGGLSLRLHRGSVSLTVQNRAVNDDCARFLRDLVLLGQTLGVCFQVEKLDQACVSLTARDVRQLCSLGMTLEADSPVLRITDEPSYQTVRVTAVTETEEMEATFCFTEPRRHRGVFNGVLTKQCTEIIQYTSPEETAVCNLASVALPRMVRTGKDGAPYFDFDRLDDVVREVTENLNRVIDTNYYPVENARRSNLRHRPVGIGVQGLADVFVMMGLPYNSGGALDLARRIFAHMYYMAVFRSTQLAEADRPYETFEGSPLSQGLLSPDLWDVSPETLVPELDWAGLRHRCRTIGTRNSLLIAPMPTASTAQILGNNESFEPFTSNVYIRRVLSGEFQVVNHHLVDRLSELGLWNPEMSERIMAHKGSIADIDEIPVDVRELFRTAWEIPHRSVCDLVVAIAPFIDQNLSLNAHIAEPTVAKLRAMHMYCYDKGLKSSLYYLRTQPAAEPIAFTVNKSAAHASPPGDAFTEDAKKILCSLEDPTACDMCSS